MRALVQRVREASVKVDGRVAGSIGPGCSCSQASAADDDDTDREWLARKIVALRIFDDEAGMMNRSIVDVGGDDSRRQPVHAVRVDEKGRASVVVRRGAARARAARVRRNSSPRSRAALGKPVATGDFGADDAGRARQRRAGDDLARFARARVAIDPARVCRALAVDAVAPRPEREHQEQAADHGDVLQEHACWSSRPWPVHRPEVVEEDRGDAA